MQYCNFLFELQSYSFTVFYTLAMTSHPPRCEGVHSIQCLRDPYSLTWNATLCKCVWMWIYWFLRIHFPVFCEYNAKIQRIGLHILEFVEFVEFVELVGFVGLARVSRHPSLARAWLGVNLLCTTVQTYNTTFSLSSSSSSSPYSS